MLGWLKDIAVNGKRFKQLQEKGKRLQHGLILLQEECVRLCDTVDDINSQVETRIRELIKTDS